MQAQTIEKYFWFGTCVRFLQDAGERFRIHGEGYVLANLQAFFKTLDELNLQVTKRAAYDLNSFMTTLAKEPSDATLSKTQSQQLSNYISEIRKTLTAEILGFEAFLVTPKRLDVKKLLEKPEDLFAPEVYWFLPDIAIYDFSEAGKCIAFERPTAAAFHLLRGTEAVLRQYYCDQVKRNRVELMWGPIIVDLRKRRKTKDKNALLNNLDNIRHSFRNPTQHPEKVYDIQEAQDLLGLCVDVVNRMIRDTRPEIGL